MTSVHDAEEIRDTVIRARRVVVKVGSSSLTTTDDGLDHERIERLVATLANVRQGGTEVVLVSSGAIAAGLAPLGLGARPRDLATQQAAASMGQGLLLARYSEAFGHRGLRVAQVLLTVDDVTRRSHYRNAHRTFAQLLDFGALPIVNENDSVATQEIRFGDNDRLAALVAHLVHADLLVLLSDVDGLYSGDPGRSDATLIRTVGVDEDLAHVSLARRGRAGVGTGGMVTKVEAARITTGAGIPAILAHASSAAEVFAGEPVGTYFLPSTRRTRSRLLWLAHATSPRGRIELDPGAVRAVCGRRASLLPAGIVEVHGNFSAGDPVDLVDDAGRVLARGLVNYDARELPQLLGRSTRDLARELGAEYEREVMHRDDLVVLTQGGPSIGRESA